MTRRVELLIANVPIECDEDYLRQWIEARSYPAYRVILIRDIVSRTSPSFAHVQLMDQSRIHEAARALNGQLLMNRNVQVTPLASKVISAA
jgi:hypothetical protein